MTGAMLPAQGATCAVHSTHRPSSNSLMTAHSCGATGQTATGAQSLRSAAAASRAHRRATPSPGPCPAVGRAVVTQPDHSRLHGANRPSCSWLVSPPCRQKNWCAPLDPALTAAGATASTGAAASSAPVLASSMCYLSRLAAAGHPSLPYQLPDEAHSKQACCHMPPALQPEPHSRRHSQAPVGQGACTCCLIRLPDSKQTSCYR